MLERYLPSSCVRLSDTSRCSTKTTKPRIMQTKPYDSLIFDAKNLGATPEASVAVIIISETAEARVFKFCTF